jgi:hypothetical protein
LKPRRCKISYYIHDIPGRLRVKSPLIQRNERLAQEVHRLLGSVQGIGSVEVKTVTGSIVVHYNPRLVESRQVVGILTQAGYFDPSKAMTHDQYVCTTVSKAGQVAWKAFFGTFVDRALEGSGLSLLTILI